MSSTNAPLPHLDLDFTEQPPIPPEGIARANELMASGRLFRYGEMGAEELDVAALEREFADLVGTRFCVALNSCGASLAVALKAAGVEPGDPVLMNAFTLAPVPGALEHVGARRVIVGISDQYTIDLADLERAAEETGARWLMLSHMRGHIANMHDVTTLTERLGVTVIEDCAHTMGASWDGQPSGTFGAVGCFSSQTFKHINSGEGGLLVTDDEDIAAKAVLLSGAYMLYRQHGAAPSEEVFRRHRLHQPNFSMRMSALAASVARPQLPLLPERAAIWNERHDDLATRLRADGRFDIPQRDQREQYVASSLQFSLPSLDEGQRSEWVDRVGAQGVAIKWFGRPEPTGFTATYDHWAYAETGRTNAADLDATRQVLGSLCDMRIPLSMTADDCETIAAILVGALPDVPNAEREQ